MDASSAPVSGASSARLVVPVGEDQSASDTSADNQSSVPGAASAASSEAASMLTARDGGAAASGDAAFAALPVPTPVTPAPPRPVGGGTLHAAKQFYLKQMLTGPGLAQARETLKTLSPERRLAQTCNIEAYGQAQHAGYSPDAIIANAYAPPQIAGSTYTVTGGAFRSDGSWRRIAYQCTLSPGMSSVTSFSFHIGADVTDEMSARIGGGG